MIRRALVSALLAIGILPPAMLRAAAGEWTGPQGGGLTVVVDADDFVFSGCLDVCRSSNHGFTWVTLNAFPGFVISETRVLTVDTDGSVYASTWTNAPGLPTGFLRVTRDEGNSWSTLSQESGIKILGLAADPFSSGTLYRTDTIGVQVGVPVRLRRSADGGATWTGIDEGLGLGAGRSITAFALDSANRGRLYVATGPTLPQSPPFGALFVTNDAGTTWSALATLPSPITTLTVDPSRPSTLYAGSSGTLRSDDGGNTFRSVASFGATQIVPDPSRPGVLYVATMGSGVQTSSDGGNTWSAMNAGLSDLNVDAIALDRFGGYLYAATNSGVFAFQFPNPNVLTLNAAHPFIVTLTATDQRTGHAGEGVATKMNDLWGYFSIPAITGNPNNPEVFVKMLDGTSLNGSYWFFYGGLTDLEYRLSVVEEETRLNRVYTKPAGSECGGSDTAAFSP